MKRTAFIILVCSLLTGTLRGAPYYVGPAATGDGSGSDRNNLMALSYTRTIASPGDTFKIVPGDYGAWDVGYACGTACPGVVISNNHIHDAASPGISVDWTTTNVDTVTIAGNHIDTQQSKPYNSSIAGNATNGQTVTCKVAGCGQTWPMWKSEQGKKSIMGKVRKHLREVHGIEP